MISLSTPRRAPVGSFKIVLLSMAVSAAAMVAFGLERALADVMIASVLMLLGAVALLAVVAPAVHGRSY